MPETHRSTAWVVVLGDFGRSPRMQYHALSLAEEAGLDVQVLAQGGSQPFPTVAQHASIHIHSIPDTPTWMQRLPRAVLLLVKPLLQALLLVWMMLARLPSPRLILLQLPPAIPTMAVCSLAAWWHHAKLIYDWHNFGYSLMGLSLGRRHWLVELAEKYERAWAKHSYASLCVSAAMQRELHDHWGVDARVCYDRPPPHFQRSSLNEVHDVLSRLQPQLQQPLHPHDYLTALYQQLTAQDVQGTLMTTCSRQGTVRQRLERPALVVSSTSWTPDEDFGILLEAVRLYDIKAEAEPGRLPPLVVVVTGRGPQREGYLRRLARLPLRRCAVRCLWLEPANYPRLLGAADLGVCLHSSSSGLDLPMKVVDMFGCGLPVCALEYDCIGEAVADGQNGMLFSTPPQLAARLEHLLAGFPAKPSRLLRHLQQGAAAAGDIRWAEGWRESVLPVVRDALEDRKRLKRT